MPLPRRLGLTGLAAVHELAIEFAFKLNGGPRDGSGGLPEPDVFTNKIPSPDPPLRSEEWVFVRRKHGGEPGDNDSVYGRFTSGRRQDAAIPARGSENEITDR